MAKKFNKEHIFSVFAILLSTSLLGACSTQQLEQFNGNLAQFNNQIAATGAALQMARPPAGAPVVAATLPPNASPMLQTVFASATPFIRQLITIHGCIKTDEGMLQLNPLSIPGKNYANHPATFWSPDGSNNVHYHDRNYCVVPENIDLVELLAANTLKFRVMYVATDSQERVYFGYIIRKGMDGQWRLERMGVVKSMIDYNNIY
jgi:hypothetical protein